MLLSSRWDAAAHDLAQVVDRGGAAGVQLTAEGAQVGHAAVAPQEGMAGIADTVARVAVTNHHAEVVDV
jgi:hypothetical protein